MNVIPVPGCELDRCPSPRKNRGKLIDMDLPRDLHQQSLIVFTIAAGHILLYIYTAISVVNVQLELFTSSG